jgi:hypothetical protein
MSSSSLSGLARPARHLLVALVLIVCALVVPMAGVAAGASTAKATPKATAATVKLQLNATERQRRHLQAAIRRSCHPGGKVCAARRARLAKVKARAASLGDALRRVRKPVKKPSGSATNASAGTTTSTGRSSTGPASPSTPSSGAPATGTPSTGSPSTGSGSPSLPSGAAVTSFQPGVNSGTTFEYDIPGALRLGAKQVRIYFPIETPASQIKMAIQKYADAGIRVLLLAVFTGRTPTVAEAQNLATWAAAYGPGGTFWAGRTDAALAVRYIEFGNETSMGYQYGDGSADASFRLRARNYALRFKDAAVAIKAAGSPVGLLAQDDDWTGVWADNMYAAVPNFHAYVAGWTTHPYGSAWKQTIDNLIKNTSRNGAPSTIPIDVTEWGLTVDNGRCLTHNYGWNRCMGTTEAASVMRRSIAEMKSYMGGRLRTFMFYQVRDQGDSGATDDAEAYFGLQTHLNGDKGALTAQARQELAAAS